MGSGERKKGSKEMRLFSKNNEKSEERALLEEVKEKFSGKTDIFIEILKGFLYSAAAFLLGACALPFGARPLGAAYLAAANKKIPYIFAGLCVSAVLSDEPVMMIASYLLVLFVRILVRLTLDTPPYKMEESGEIELSELIAELFRENLYLRMATASVGVFAISLYSLIKGGFLFYDLFGAVLSMLAAPLFTLAVYALFCESAVPKAYSYISASVLGFFLVFSARELEFYGVSLAAFGAMLASLYICKKSGLLVGVASGAILGLAYSPILSPAFFLAVLAWGSLKKVSGLLSCTAAFGVGVAYAIFADGISALTELLPAMLASCLLFAVLDKTFLADPEKRVKDKISAVSEREVRTQLEVSPYELTEVRLLASLKRQRMLCDTFSSMSEFFSELGEKMKQPLVYDSKNICDRAFDASCASCRCNTLCWEEKHTDTLAALNGICTALHRNGKIEKKDIPEQLRSVCERVGDITDEINYNYSLHMRQLLLCDKSEIFATDYRAMSELLSAGLMLDGDEYSSLEQESARLSEALRNNELGITSAVVFGKRRKRILLQVRDEDIGEFKSILLEGVEKALGVPFVIEKIESNREGALVKLIERKKFKAEYAELSLPSVYEKEFCGDCAAVFENGDGRVYSLISDGMGSGRDAALTSGICVMFLKKMLSVSADCVSSLKLLNEFLRNKGSGSVHECSATLDMMELDLISARASFYKSGAAPSYVLRDNELYKLRSSTLPLGILKELDSKKLSFEIKEGDVVIMVSDGVTSGRDECSWLSDILKNNIDKLSLYSCAELIAQRAKKENESDDISVTLIKIEKNQ